MATEQKDLTSSKKGKMTMGVEGALGLGIASGAVDPTTGFICMVALAAVYAISQAAVDIVKALKGIK